MLAQPNALPRSQRQLAVGDRDCQGAAQEAGLHVRGLKGYWIGYYSTQSETTENKRSRLSDTPALLHSGSRETFTEMHLNCLSGAILCNKQHKKNSIKEFTQFTRTDYYLADIASKNSTYIRTGIRNKRTDKARLTRLVILINNKL